MGQAEGCDSQVRPAGRTKKQRGSETPSTHTTTYITNKATYGYVSNLHYGESRCQFFCAIAHSSWVVLFSFV